MKVILVLPVVLAVALGGALAEETSQNGDTDTDLVNVPTLHLRGASDMLLNGARDPLSKGRGLLQTLRRPKCTSDADCDATTSYCAGRRCLPMGSCRRNIDCFSPGNLYSSVECIGDILCSAEKQCVRECKIEPGPCL